MNSGSNVLFTRLQKSIGDNWSVSKSVIHKQWNNAITKLIPDKMIPPISTNINPIETIF